jgi:hypothetical protein
VLKLPKFNQVSAKSSITTAAIVIAIFAFIFSGFLRRGSGVQNHIAAQIGDQYVSMTEYQAAIQQELQGQDLAQMSESEKQGLTNKALQSLVKEKVLVHEGYRMGFSSSDAEVAKWITQQEPFQKEGKFDEKTYRKFLENNMSEFELFRIGRDTVMQEKVVEFLTNPITQPQIIKTLEDSLASKTYQISVLPVLLKTAVTNEILAKETKTLLESDQLETLKAEYEAHPNLYSQKEQVELEVIQLHLTSRDNTTFSCENADELFTKLKKDPQQWGSLATQHSVHKSKEQKGYMGWVEIDLFDETIQTTLRNLPLNQISSLTQNEEGCWIFRKKNEKQAFQKSFEDVKQEMAEAKIKEDVTSRLKLEIRSDFEKALRVKNKAEQLETIEELRQKWKLEWKASEPDKKIGIKDYLIPEIGLNVEVRKYLPFFKEKDDIIPKIISSSHGSFLLKVEDFGTSENEDKKEPVLPKEETELTQKRARQQFLLGAKALLYNDYVDKNRINFSSAL